MNRITRHALPTLGYDFIPAEYLPKGKDEYHLRNMQNRRGTDHRQLTAHEIEVLVRNRNQSDDWNKILVSDAFNPELVKNCKFFGLVRIGKLEPWFLDFNNLRLPVGLYDSTICSCDFGDNVVINNVSFMSHYIVGDEVIIVNVNELSTTNYAKFGNGIVKAGESENLRIWMELCNENGGRKVIPFNGMLPGDAFLWSRFRDDLVLQDKFKAFTEKKFDKQRGYYGKIGDRTVIKNCKIIKDVWVGSDAYLKGANKLKNLTINSSAEASSQIGEGCEIVNGIIDYGCRIFYGVKAVRFVMASHSQLKYGARLLNSYLGSNATISCCEVLNSLIFPAHEQHHNNSFLCAALVMGQSNMAAGATVGSNHNSRGADGELIAGRGFWPGLCVSLKHNSRFASFNMLAKGDFPAELDIPLPFALISNDVTHDRLVVMPGYWFMYNMYALARNAWKYVDRDKRYDKTQRIEYNFLAPDSVNDIVNSLRLLEQFTGRALQRHQGLEAGDEASQQAAGRKALLDKDPILDQLEIMATGFEHSTRPILLTKVPRAYHMFRELVGFYLAQQLMEYVEANKINSLENLLTTLPKKPKRTAWMNVGGQLIPEPDMDDFRKKVHGGKIQSWEQVHTFYEQKSQAYDTDKLHHALAGYYECMGLTAKAFDKAHFQQLIQQAVVTKTWMTEGIYTSRAKDYENPFRNMVYENEAEMEIVIGKLDDNSFIKQENVALEAFVKLAQKVIKQVK